MKMKKNLLALCLTPLLFIACGGETEVATPTLNADNYIKVAKSIYAEQNGANTDITIVPAPGPGQSLDEDVIYLKKSVKPRNYQVSEVVVQQGNKTLSVTVDKANKYAKVTLSGEVSAEQTLDMKTFTLPR